MNSVFNNKFSKKITFVLTFVLLLLLTVTISKSLRTSQAFSSNQKIAQTNIYTPPPSPTQTPTSTPTPLPSPVVSAFPSPVVSSAPSSSPSPSDQPDYPCISRVYDLTGSPACGLEGYTNFSYQCIDGVRGTISSTPDACLNFAEGQSAAIDNCGRTCMTPYPSPPPTADPTAKVTTCQTNVYKIPHNAKPSDYKSFFIDKYKIDPSTNKVEVGDIYGYNITISNANTYDVGGSIELYTHSNNEVNEPIKMLATDPNCTWYPGQNFMTCNERVSVGALSSLVTNSRLLVEITGIPKGSEHLGLSYIARHGASPLDCGNIAMNYSKKPPSRKSDAEAQPISISSIRDGSGGVSNWINYNSCRLGCYFDEGVGSWGVCSSQCR